MRQKKKKKKKILLRRGAILIICIYKDGWLLWAYGRWICMDMDGYDVVIGERCFVEMRFITVNAFVSMRLLLHVSMRLLSQTVAPEPSILRKSFASSVTASSHDIREIAHPF